MNKMQQNNNHKSNLAMQEQTLLEQEIEFATKKHENQKYGDVPYKDHLSHVQQVAKRHELGEFLEAAAWLHDCIEDCEVTYEDIEDLFGYTMAEVVWSVTVENPAEPRNKRVQETCRKTRLSLQGVLLKLCDRIANVEFAVATGRKSIFKMYLKENELFLTSLGLRREVISTSARYLLNDLDNALNNGKIAFKL